MTNLVNHAANRWVVDYINRVPDPTQTQSLHNKSLVLVESNGATYQRDGHARRRFIPLSSSGHLCFCRLPESAARRHRLRRREPLELDSTEPRDLNRVSELVQSGEGGPHDILRIVTAE